MSGEMMGADTSTISTIVLQSQETKMVVALLQSGSKVSLKLIDMRPSMACLGHDFEEAAGFQNAHLKVVEQLQSKQNPVEDLLRQADELIQNQKPRAGVYAAMAESLGAAWEDLHNFLDQRRAIVDKNFLFRGHLQDFNDKVDELKNMLLKAQSSLKNPNVLVKEILGQKKKMLEASVFALQEGDALINALLHAWHKTIPGMTPQATRCDLISSIDLVEIWMESIHCRRMEVTKLLDNLMSYFKGQTDLVEEFCHYVTSRRGKLDILDLGTDSGAAEETLKEHNIELEGLLAKKSSLPQEYTDQVNEKASEFEALLRLRTDILTKAIHLHLLLHESQEKLKRWESNAANLQDESSVNHIIHTIETMVTKLEHEVTRLIHDAGQVNGQGLVQAMKDLNNRCTHLKSELVSKRQSLQRHSASMKNFQAKLDELSNWLQHLESEMKGTCRIGTTQAQAAAFLSKSKDQLYALQRKSFELEGMQGAFNIISDPEGAQISTDQVKKKIHQLNETVGQRIDVTSTYVKFLKLADDILEEMKALFKLLKGNQDESEQLEMKRQAIQQLYLQICTLAKNCNSQLSEKSNAKINSDVAKSHIKYVMESINGKQNDLIQEWNNVKNGEECVAHIEKRCSEIKSLWTKYTPMLRSIDDPKFIVMALEKSYETLAQIRKVNSELGDKLKTTNESTEIEKYKAFCSENQVSTKKRIKVFLK